MITCLTTMLFSARMRLSCVWLDSLRAFSARRQEPAKSGCGVRAYAIVTEIG